jgi:lysophospholipase L1-like esterase
VVNDKPVYRVTRRRALGSVGAIAAPLMLAGVMPTRTGVQEATAMATPGTPGPSLESVSMVQFMHPEKIYFYLPGFQDEVLLAGLLGLDVETYRAIKADFAAVARAAAEELLAESAFAGKVDRLPFQSGSLVVAIGESDTDDLQSWFEILRHLLDLRRPQDGIRLVNAGISGQTTTQAFDQVMQAVAQQPDWVFCLLGGNDSWRTGSQPTKTLVSIEETEKNLAEMRRLIMSGTEARWVWMTRTPIDEARMEADPGFQLGNVVIRNADIEQVNEYLYRQPEPVVDSHAAFGDPSSSELLTSDGLHPSLAGHKAIARAVVERLAE